MRHWYQDRDFPEIKAETHGGPNEIVAVVESREQRSRLVEEHNEAIQKLYVAEGHVAKLKSVIAFLPKRDVKADEYAWMKEAVLKRDYVEFQLRIIQLEEALKYLVCEARGFLSLATPQSHGVTNIRVMRYWIDRANSHPGEQGHYRVPGNKTEPGRRGWA